jgi:hypothetical protein
MQSGHTSFENLRHFIGVVEDRNDPEKLGRVKVRVYSIHNESKSEIKTKDLPWAMVLQPNNPATSGIGYSGTGLVEGTWVFGLFLDPVDFQNPLILGALHGKPTIGPNKDAGFNDPKGKYPQNDAEVHLLGESSVSRLARGLDAEGHRVLSEKRAGKTLLDAPDKDGIEGVKVAKGPEMNAVISKEVFAKYTERESWKEPHPRIGQPGLKSWDESKRAYSFYPMNHVWYTEGGHALEVDDTPGAGRLHWYHNSGTFQEIIEDKSDPDAGNPFDGTRITKVVGDDYEIDLRNKRIYIKGNYDITVDGDMRELIAGDKITEIGGNHIITIGKNYVKKVVGGEFKEILSDKSTQINKNKSERVSENKTETVVGNTTVSLSGTKTETVSGEEKKTNLSTSTHILPDNFTLFGANNMNIAAGGNLSIAAEGVLNLTGTANAVLSTPATLDIDANTALTMNAPTLTIDGPAGSIKSNDIELHTHTHEGSPTAGQGPKSDTGAPK